MSLKNSHPQPNKNLNPFVFEECDSSGRVLVSTTPLANEMLPFPKNYQFQPFRMQKIFPEYGNQFRDFAVREDDVWVLAFPKAGSTWVQNIVWQLKHGLELTKEPMQLNDVQFLEWPLFTKCFDAAVNERIKSLHGNALKELDEAPSPRIIKSHLPPNLLPVGLWTVRPKMIYIARNPKDVATSYYHMARNDLHMLTGTYEEFLDSFMGETSTFGPFSGHILSFWELRHLNNFLFLTYEELSADRFKGVKKISEFLGCKYNDEDLGKLTEYASFENMRKMITTDFLITPDRDPKYRFFRRGKAGGFADEMSREYIEKFDKWTTERFRNTDFKFTL